MKTIEFKSHIHVLPDGNKKELTTKELLRLTINSVPEGGFTPSEMMLRLRLLNVLDSSNGEMKIEDADYEKISALVKSMRWGIPSQFIIDFVNSF